MPFWRAGGVVAAASATASCQVAGGLGAAVAWLRLNACGRGRAAAGTVVVLSLRPSLALRWLSRPPNYEFPRSESRDPLVSMYASATFCQAEAQQQLCLRGLGAHTKCSLTARLAALRGRRDLSSCKAPSGGAVQP